MNMSLDIVATDSHSTTIHYCSLHKTCMQVECTKPLYDRPPLNGCGQGHVTRFLNFAPNHMFVIGEARHFKFSMLIDTQEY